jgi:hypothetical protein
MKQTPVEWLVSALDALDEQIKVAPKTTNYKSTRESIIKQAQEMEKEMAQQYAEFAIECDRKELPVLEFDGWINL